MHTLITGITGCGKTTVATGMAKGFVNRRVKVIVLDPLTDKRWFGPETRVFTDSQLFLECADSERSLAIFLDESAETVGRYNDEMFWLATRGRHYGHACTFITQRPQQLNTTVRDQCELLLAFRVSERDAKLLADCWAKPELLQACTLDKGEFFHAPKFGEVKRFNAFPRRQQVNGEIKGLRV